jgi:hypothetical protein
VHCFPPVDDSWESLLQLLKKEKVVRFQDELEKLLG